MRPLDQFVWLNCSVALALIKTLTRIVCIWLLAAVFVHFGAERRFLESTNLVLQVC